MDTYLLWNQPLSFYYQLCTNVSKISGFSKITNEPIEIDNYFDIRYWILPREYWFIILISAVGFTVVRSIICFFFRQFAKYLNVKDKVNFAESLWKTIFYILSFSFAVYIAYDYNMIFDQRNCWNDYGKKPKTSLLIYYYFIEL
jgi:hypothetical protein